MKKFEVKTMTATFTIEASWEEAAWLDLQHRGILDILSIREVRHD